MSELVISHDGARRAVVQRERNQIYSLSSLQFSLSLFHGVCSLSRVKSTRGRGLVKLGHALVVYIQLD